MYVLVVSLVKSCGSILKSVKGLFKNESKCISLHLKGTNFPLMLETITLKCESIDPEDNICKHIKLYHTKDLYIWWNLVERNVNAGSRENKKKEILGEI